jgi:serine phosphatase RsbU (regulator of sigma subunit)/ligand-binding sensor domain-containing protein
MSSEDHVSIEGKAMMLDGKTPHIALVVQAIRGSETVATTLTDEGGRYQFISLKPGDYHVRCYTFNGYIYYDGAKVLKVEDGKTLKDIDFHLAPFKKGSWRHYSRSDGLAHNTVNKMYIDPDGFMWLGTDAGGISRYDGKEFVNFTSKDGLPVFAPIWCINRDPGGIMWFGTWRKGLYRYDGKRFMDFAGAKGAESLARRGVTSIEHDSFGNTWFSTNHDIYKYDGSGEIEHLEVRDLLPEDTFISHIYQTADEKIWFMTSSGTFLCYDGKRFEKYSLKEALSSNYRIPIRFSNDHPNRHYMPIHTTQDGAIWVGLDSGAYGYDGTQYSQVTMDDGIITFDRIMGINSDPDGTLWLGALEGGIACYDGKGLVNFTNRGELLSNSVMDLHIDSDGTIWIASGSVTEQRERGGLSRYDRKTFVNFTTKDGLADNNISVLFYSSDDNLWIGTLGGGVSCYDGKKFTTYTEEDGLASNFIVCIYQDSDGVIWFGSGTFFQHGSKGVSRYDTRTKRFLKSFTVDDGLASNTVYSIYGDQDGVIWLGTDKGISRYDSRTGNFLKLITTEDGLADDSVNLIWADPHGTIWFFSYEAMLSSLDDESITSYDGMDFVRYNHMAGLDIIFNAIKLDRGESIWKIGVPYGVIRYDGRESFRLTQGDGLADDLVRAVYPHVHGLRFLGRHGSDDIIWFGTDSKGIILYDGIAWSSLDKQDGMAGDTVVAIMEGSDGSLWFGTRDGGLTCYRRNSSCPKAYIKSVITDKTYRDLSSIPVLMPGMRITIEYSSIDFKTIPEKRQYRCRVQASQAFGKGLMEKGMDSGWRKPVRSEQFEWIPEETGKYTFQVQAIDRDLNYSEPASLELKVIPDPRDRRIIQLEAHIREQELAEMQRMQQELEDARQIQLSLLPDRPPELEGFEIAGTSLPAKEVSGDFYTYPSLGKNTGIVLADVTGKSVKAAMVAAMTSGMLNEAIKMRSELWNSPGKILSELNTGLQPHLIRSMYTAMSLGILNTDKKKLIFSNAGMPYPIVKRGREVWELEVNGMPLGLMSGAEYTDLSVSLEAGDYVIFCSDGVIEAENEAEEMYGTERLLHLVTGIDSAASAEDVIQAILQDVARFTGDAERYDDMTVVVIKKYP